jgi:hypothetical protein
MEFREAAFSHCLQFHSNTKQKFPARYKKNFVMSFILRECVENYVWNICLYFKCYEYGDNINIFGFVTGMDLWEIIHNTSKEHEHEHWF